MGEILPDGSIQGYTGRCDKCGKSIETNMQGNSLENHVCKVPLSGVEEMAEKYAKGRWKETAGSLPVKLSQIKISKEDFIAGYNAKPIPSIPGDLKAQFEAIIKDYAATNSIFDKADLDEMIIDCMTVAYNLSPKENMRAVIEDRIGFFKIRLCGVISEEWRIRYHAIVDELTNLLKQI